MRIDEIRAGCWIENPFINQQNSVDISKSTFKDTLKNFLSDVNTSQKTASTFQAKMISGESVDVHQVIVKSEEANVGFNMLMELRNKSMEGFHEIMRTRL